MGCWHRLLVATLAAVGLYSSWSVVEQNILAFADYNATGSIALQMMAEHMEWVAPAAPAWQMGDARGDDNFGWARWDTNTDDFDAFDTPGGRGTRARLLGYSALTIAANRADEAAAGANKAQQIAITTAAMQMALLLDATIQAATTAWPSFTTSTSTDAATMATSIADEQWHAVAGFVQTIGAPAATSQGACPASHVPFFDFLEEQFAIETAAVQLHAAIMDRHGVCPVVPPSVEQALGLCSDEVLPGAIRIFEPPEHAPIAC